MNTFAIALLPLVGAIIGAVLQFVLGRTADKEKRIELIRSEAYADYLRSVAAAAHLTSDDDLVGALKAAADAKSRIVVYGSPRVIEALAQFEESGAVLNTESSVKSFIRLVSAMRPVKASIQDRDIRLILLGIDRT